MTPEQFQEEVLSTSDLARITSAIFIKMMKDEDVTKEIAVSLSQSLHEKFNRDYSFEEIGACLTFIDKSLFIQLRDG